MRQAYKNVKAILFDSGHTLNRPRTGHWFIPPRFYEYIDRSLLQPDSEQLRAAFRKANGYLMKNHLIKTEAEEFAQFREFYRMVLEECCYPCVNDGILDALANDTVYNDDKFVFFDDVEPVLKALGERYALGVVSDTWPSLERVFVNKGLRQYFSSFAMSSVHGQCKSDRTLFDIALKELDVKPYEAVFVDDAVSNLRMAKENGMIPVWIDRYEKEKGFARRLASKLHFALEMKGCPCSVASLQELADLLL